MKVSSGSLQGRFYYAGDVWQCLETSVVVMAWWQGSEEVVLLSLSWPEVLLDTEHPEPFSV